MASFPRAASWSFQQAAEKAFKSMLILKEQTPLRTHDLLALFNSVVALSDDWEGLRSDVLRLAEISASSRYPDDLSPIENSEIERFAESAQNIVAQVREDISIRARRGQPEALRDVLAKVPDVPPLPGDELR